MGKNEPLFHFDYIRDVQESIPVAHTNIHAHRDEVVFAMMLGKRKRAKSRAKDVDSGRVPTHSDLHLPVGGHRFRPSLEDVLEMLMNEFGVDVQKNALKAVRESRSRYRSTQVRAAVTDDLEAAAQVLRDNGYQVSPPEHAPESRTSRLERY